ncbi:MAG: hypothetical protein MH472_06990 [Bacteroidia bacterium]|nr:hypothetical protein [Bacteroidia bacterium]
MNYFLIKSFIARYSAAKTEKKTPIKVKIGNELAILASAYFPPKLPATITKIICIA